MADKSPLREVKFVSTGLAPLDDIMGGGVRMRRITQFSGDQGTGKTTVSYMIIANAQKAGYKTMWFDTEKRFEYDFAESLGVNLKKLEFSHEKIAEDIFEESLKWAEKNDGVFVIDSIGGLHTRKEAEAEVVASFPETPKLLPIYTRKLVSALCGHECAAVLLNHEKITFEGKLKVLGGTSIPYHSTNWVRFRRTPKKVMSGETEIASYVEAIINKGKFYHQKCELVQKSTGGFDMDFVLIDNALAKGIITKDGNTYYFGEEKLCVGLAKLKGMFEDPSFNERVKGALAV